MRCWRRILLGLLAGGGLALAQDPARPQAVHAESSGVIRLRAEDAVLKGSTFKLETKWGDPNIGYWLDAKDEASWTVQVDKPGAYLVEMDYACEGGSAGGVMEIWMGFGLVVLTTRDTGGWGSFQTAKLGSVDLPESGPVQVRAKVSKIVRSGILNLREIRLKPVR